MDFGAIIELVSFWTLLLGMPALAVVLFLMTFVHQSELALERAEHLRKVRDRADRSTAARNKYSRLLDPLFRFRDSA
jgi:hypothetical protein